MARTHHPDKAKGDAEKLAVFEKAKEVYDFCKLAHQVLGTLNESGQAYPERVKYDRKGKQLRDQFAKKFNDSYPNVSFRQRAKQIQQAQEQEEITNKANMTREKNKNRNEGLLEIGGPLILFFY